MLTGSQFWKSIRHAYDRYSRMMEKQGFYIVMAVCVLVIALSALYTFHFREEWTASEAPANGGEIIAAGIQEAQTLREAQELVQSLGAVQTAIPTEAPYRFSEPVKGVLIRDYSVETPQLFEHARYWRIHPGIDLQAEYGAIVKACASGEVVDVWQDHEMGKCIRIRHESGLESIYAGLSETEYVRAGDPVASGQTIGHVGNGVVAESDAEPHLHFEVWKNNHALDPVKLFLGTIQP